jgi:TonB family protein
MLLGTAVPQEKRQLSDTPPYVVGNGVQAPVVLTQPLPAYTDEARAARIEGRVLLQVIIRKDGSVDSFKVLQGLGYGLDQSAITTIATKWRFKPGTLNNEPVDVQAMIEVSFKLYGRPEDAERLKAYPLRVQIVAANWDQVTSVTMGSGYGNLWTGVSPRGFAYTTSCVSGIFAVGILFAKWIEPESRLEILTAANGIMKTCALEVTMHNTIFTLKDGQAVAADPLNLIPK